MIWAFHVVAADEWKYRHLVRIGTIVVEKEFLPQPKGKSVLVDFKNPIGSPMWPWEIMSLSEYLHQLYDAKRRTQVCESKEQGSYYASDAIGWVTPRKALLVSLPNLFSHL